MAILDISTMLKPEERARALERIGYFDDTKKRGRQVDYRRLLDWFVELSRKNLATMRPEELRELHEEVRALQEEGSRGVTLSEDEASTAAHVPSTQTKVAEYLEHLTRTGRIEFEEFKLCPSIELPRFRPGSKLPYSIIIGELVEPYHGKGLLYLFFLALKGAGDRLRQCPHCTTLFVQARRKQRFCTSQHQQVASMRDLRARRTREREARKMARDKRRRDARTLHTRAKKGAKSHGTKKRR